MEKYGIEKLQTGSNLKHDKRKQKLRQKHNKRKQKFRYCSYVELHYCSKGESEICNEHMCNIHERFPPHPIKAVYIIKTSSPCHY